MQRSYCLMTTLQIHQITFMRHRSGEKSDKKREWGGLLPGCTTCWADLSPLGHVVFQIILSDVRTSCHFFLNDKTGFKKV